MVNPFVEVNWRPGRSERRQFARSLVLGFPLVGVALLLLGAMFQGRWDAHLRAALWVAGAGAGLGAVLWLLPGVARPFYVVWYFLACCLGFVVGNTLLAAFYYLVLTPFGVCRRVLGKRPFARRGDPHAATYWKEHPGPPDPSRYYRQF